jgi:mannose-6-phosphate isomerase-like protein (cupin superfamily)
VEATTTAIAAALGQVGPGLKQLRTRRGVTLVLGAGQAAEFDTRVPHWFGNPGPGPAEMLCLYGPQGERMHVRARTR